MKTYKVILKFSSTVKLTTFLGLCGGIVAVPIAFIVNAIRLDPRVQVEITDYLQAVIGIPLQGLILGALIGILGFPLYKLFSNKFGGLVLNGKFND